MPPSGINYSPCCRLFENKRSRQVQAGEHTRDSTLNCICCSTTQNYKNALNKHMKENIEKHLTCLICSFKVEDKDQSEHLKIHDICFPTFKKEKCMDCDYRTVDKDKMIIHRFKKHINPGCTPADNLKRIRVKKKVVPPLKEVVCLECKETFSSLAHRRRHNKMHNAGKLLYSCPYCEYRTDFPNAVVIHRTRKHLGQKESYKCAKCEFLTPNISFLKRHIGGGHFPREVSKVPAPGDSENSTV